MPPENAALGNALIAKLTGIDVRGRSSEAGYRLFDEWPQAQAGLLARLTQQPYVAHNATFEHSWFMLNVAGYAESYRAGRITIIDTLPMSRQWDPGAVPTNEHPYGDNTLDAYAKRQGALDSAHNERHLGLEDSHIMLVAMKHHLAALKAQRKGPWGPPAGRASAASPAVVSGEYTIGLVSNYQDSRQQRENRRRTIVRVVCVVIAVAMLGSLIIPAIYAGL